MLEMQHSGVWIETMLLGSVCSVTSVPRQNSWFRRHLLGWFTEGDFFDIQLGIRQMLPRLFVPSLVQQLLEPSSANRRCKVRSLMPSSFATSRMSKRPSPKARLSVCRTASEIECERFSSNDRSNTGVKISSNSWLYETNGRSKSLITRKQPPGGCFLLIMIFSAPPSLADVPAP